MNTHSTFWYIVDGPDGPCLMGFSPSKADEFENDADDMDTLFTLIGQGQSAEQEARRQLAEYDPEYDVYAPNGEDTSWYIVGDDPESTHLQGVPSHEVTEFEASVIGWGIGYTLIGQGQGAEQEARNQLDRWIGDYKVSYSLYPTATSLENDPGPDMAETNSDKETNFVESTAKLEINNVEIQPPTRSTPLLNRQGTEFLTLISRSTPSHDRQGTVDQTQTSRSTPWSNSRGTDELNHNLDTEPASRPNSRPHLDAEPARRPNSRPHLGAEPAQRPNCTRHHLASSCREKAFNQGGCVKL